MKRLLKLLISNVHFLLTIYKVKELGYAFYFRNVKEDDLNLLFKINEVGFEFFERLSLNERKLYTISYDFHIINEKGKDILINHKLTPLFLTEEGKIWKAMCIVALATENTSGNITISKHASDTIWKFDVKREIWSTEEKVQLSERVGNYQNACDGADH
jgi:hypothetical protein